MEKLANLLTTTTNAGSHNTCRFCGTKYTRKISYNKHVILCEILHKPKRESICDDEESLGIPSHEELYNIVLELAYKNKKLEEKMEKMQKWVALNKTKLNVIKWLNTNVIPETTFTALIHSIDVTDEDVDLLISENAIHTMNSILKRNIDDGQINPVHCFVQKTNLLYVYDTTTKSEESGEFSWKKMAHEDFIKLMQSIHSKLIGKLSEWQKKNEDKISTCDKTSILFSKTMVKILGINFDFDSPDMTKLRTNLYNNIKVDIKNIVEYDIEF
jgi:hypothetical protein